MIQEDKLEEAKRLYETANADQKHILERLFPELKESEDERIRKELILYLGDMPEDTELRNGVTNRDVLVWLEKQGENKPANKVEPKFKLKPKFEAGNWVVTDKNDVVQIKTAKNGLYTIGNGMVFIASYVDKYWHHWTTKDAKDGDVLVEMEYERPFIFKGLLDILHPESPVAYCGIDVMDTFLQSTDSRWWTSKEVCPATKEQRDTLMKAMTNAGYTFDFEKKELKKIEQKIEQKLDTDFSDLSTWKYIVDAVLTEKEGIGQYLDSPFTEEVAKKLQKRFSNIQQNPTWSEKDEKIKESIITGLEMLKDGASDKSLIALYNKKIDWLKHLRNRVQPQSQWKPSKEQMERLKGTINSLPHQEVLYSLYQDLKKLK